MNQSEIIQEFPTRRIKPFDGLAVTAAVWEEAHEYHRRLRRFHDLFSHRPGIVTGLEVIASDPPDQTVYIRPGIAVDPLGRTIVLTEPVAYDFGQEMEGLLYLLLSYGESQPRAEKGSDQQSPLYIHTEFTIHARPTLPDSPWVELARVRRQTRDAALLDAENPAHPGPNEIDPRFRRQAGADPQEIISLAVCHLGEGERRHTAGADFVARALGRTGFLRAAVDEDIPLAEGLERYTLLYLVGRGTWQLSRDEMNALYAYLQGGGTVLLESCGPESAAADAAFADLLAAFGFQLADLPPGHPLLTTPYLFAAPPKGAAEEGEGPAIQIGQGVIWSRRDYGCLWQGAVEPAPSREAIRAGLEWGCNVVTYAYERRRGAKSL
ncbi:MAG TPA: DUF4159 domain-containing protein [Anaerolineae bacterium]|nr:DUF4159 domain-containing protein [Anaerolineae bacterium]